VRSLYAAFERFFLPRRRCAAKCVRHAVEPAGNSATSQHAVNSSIKAQPASNTSHMLGLPHSKQESHAMFYVYAKLRRHPARRRCATKCVRHAVNLQKAAPQYSTMRSKAACRLRPASAMYTKTVVWLSCWTCGRPSICIVLLATQSTKSPRVVLLLGPCAMMNHRSRLLRERAREHTNR
jgi:hypothetical protein